MVGVGGIIKCRGIFRRDYQVQGKMYEGLSGTVEGVVRIIRYRGKSRRDYQVLGKE